jgi:hypothetical protein
MNTNSNADKPFPHRALILPGLMQIAIVLLNYAAVWMGLRVNIHDTFIAMVFLFFVLLWFSAVAFQVAALWEVFPKLFDPTYRTSTNQLSAFFAFSCVVFFICALIFSTY